MKHAAATLATAFLLFSFVMLAEEIHLKDGNKVSGTLMAVEGNVLQVKTNYGVVRIPKSDVVSIEFPENQPPKPENAAKKFPTIDEALEGTTYTNQTAKFLVKLPEGWIIAPTLRRESPDIVAALSSADATLFFLVTPEKFVGTLATYRVLVETQVQTKFTDYQKLEESNLSLDGRSAMRLIWKAKNPKAGNVPMQAAVYILPQQGGMVRLTFLTLEPLFADALPKFEKIAASYHSLDPAQ